MKKKDPTHNTQQLGNLLARYKTHIKPPQKFVITEVVEVVKEVMGIDVLPAQFQYTVSSKTLYIKTPSLLRTEIVKKKHVILSTLEQRLGKNNAPREMI